MDIQAVLEDDSVRLLGKALSMTLFIAVLAWLPLRTATALWRRLQEPGRLEEDTVCKSRSPRFWHVVRSSH